MLTDFIDANYSEACPSQEFLDRDRVMIDLMQPGKSFDKQQAYDWLRSYGLFQGIKNVDRWKVVDAIRNLRDDLSPLQAGRVDEDLCDNLNLILSELYRTKPRLWLSLASKVLWCRFPAEAVIYDSYVERTLIVLQWLDEALLEQPRIGSPPKVKSKKQISGVVEFYRRYDCQVRALETKYRSQLSEMREAHSTTYPYDIRILDQLLWMIGRKE